MIKDLLAKDEKISNIEIADEGGIDGQPDTHRVLGKFIRDEMIYSFLNLTSDKFNFISVRFQFIYKMKNKKIIRDDILELINAFNKIIPSVKVYLNGIEGKDVKVNFNVEIPYFGENTLSSLIFPAIEVVSFAPHLFSARLKSKGFEHQTLS